MSEKQMTCKELVELVTAYLDGALDANTHALFNAHLVYCDGCRNYLEQFRVTVRTIGKIRDDELDPTFRSRLLDAFKDFR
jgi:predicted anti-sigma-YlaC factor YlaD